jgi:hypothetical protein
MSAWLGAGNLVLRSAQCGSEQKKVVGHAMHGQQPRAHSWISPPSFSRLIACFHPRPIPSNAAIATIDTSATAMSTASELSLHANESRNAIKTLPVKNTATERHTAPNFRCAVHANSLPVTRCSLATPQANRADQRTTTPIPKPIKTERRIGWASDPAVAMAVTDTITTNIADDAPQYVSKARF